MSKAIACHILTREDEIDCIACAWQTLARSVKAPVFGDPSWFYAWWRTIGKTEPRSLHIVVAQRGETLVGLLPLTVLRRHGVRILEWAGNALLDYLQAIAVDEDDEAVVQALWNAARSSDAYDCAMVRDVLPETMDCAYLLNAKARIVERTPAPFLDLVWPDGATWLQGRKKKYRRDFKHKAQLLERQGNVSLTVRRQGRIPEEALATMVGHKKQWCAGRGKNSVFGHPHILDAFCALANAADDQNALFFATLDCQKTPIAWLLGLAKNDTLHCYFAGYDPAWSAYSPGSLLFTHTIAWAIDHGFKRYDFMRGEESYKLRFTSQTRYLTTFCYARTALGACAIAFYCLHRRLYQGAKKALRRLPSSVQKKTLALLGKSPASVNADLSDAELEGTS